MKTNACGDSVNCCEAISQNQTGDFALPVKGLHGFLAIMCVLMNTPIYRKEKLYIASQHHRISNLLFLLLNNSL